MMSLTILRAQIGQISLIGKVSSRFCFETFSTRRTLNRAKPVRPAPKASTSPSQATTASQTTAGARTTASSSSPSSSSNDSQSAPSPKGNTRPTARPTRQSIDQIVQAESYQPQSQPRSQPPNSKPRSQRKSDAMSEDKSEAKSYAKSENKETKKKKGKKSKDEVKEQMRHTTPGSQSDSMRTPKRKFISKITPRPAGAKGADPTKWAAQVKAGQGGQGTQEGFGGLGGEGHTLPELTNEQKNLGLRKRVLDVLKPFMSPPVQHIRRYEEESEEQSDTPTAQKRTPKVNDPTAKPKGKLTFSKYKQSLDDAAREKEKDRPFTLPSGSFKPLQSLGQNFLSDQNYVRKIVEAFKDDSEMGKNVVEIGPGPGALTRVLYPKYPNMTAIEIDARAVEFLNEKLPGLNVQHLDVLQTDWPQLAADKGGSLNIIANLPYYIVSQVLFSLADSHRAVDTAVLTMQLEVALRITAKPSTKDYGIPSVVFQLYGEPHINFLIPPSVFYPKPKVDSALLTLDFRKPNPALYRVNGDHLRRVLTASFQQRRKMLRHSLKDLLVREGFNLSDKWATKRPEQLTPVEFVEMTIELFGEEPQPERTIKAEEVVLTPKIKREVPVLQKKKKMTEEQIAAAAHTAALEASLLAAQELEELEPARIALEAIEKRKKEEEITRRERITYVTRPVWRESLFGASGSKGFGMDAEEEVVEKQRLEKKKLEREEKKRLRIEDEKFLMGE